MTIPFAFRLAGGWTSIKSNIPPEALSFTKGIGGAGHIIGYVIMYLASFSVGQEAVSRYYAARDGKAAVQGSIAAAIINFIFAFVPVVLGLAMLAMKNQGILDASVVDALENNSRYALPALANVAMPAIICGLLFAGIISATMSSADSDLLGAGSMFSNDIYKVFLKKDVSSKEVLLVTKIGMIVIGIFAYFVARWADNIISLLAFSFTLRAAGTFCPYVFGHFWEKSSSAGSIASILGGSLFYFLLDKGVIPSIASINNIIPALLLSLILFVGFSLLFPPKELTVDLAFEED
jgi:SSS family solute:Na+ symporter